MTTATTRSPGTALRVSGLRVGYREETVVDGVSFSLAPGEIVALVGESGSGKTTTAQTILGLLPEEAVVDGGSVRLGDEELLRRPERELRPLRGARLGYVPQDPGASLDPVQRVRDQIAEVLRVHRIGTRGERRARVDAALRAAGIAEPERVGRQFPHELSGGLQQRALIAQALVAGPSVIVADEPTSALDVTVQKEVLDNLSRAVRESGVSLLLITHDLAVAAERADRVLVLQGGAIIEEGPALRVLGDPRHAYTRRLVAATPATIAESLRERRSRAHSDPGAPEILRVQGLSKTFRRGGSRRGEPRAVDDVSFSLSQGRTLALVGESGSGKTTTARILSRLETADTGSVRIGAEDVTHIKGEALRVLRRRIQYVHQNPRSALDPRFTVAEAIAEPLRAFGDSAAARRARVDELLERVALAGSLRERSTARLSGGQAQRVAIARALALDPAVLVLDEAVSALDVATQERILELLGALQAQLDLSYVFVSHDLAVVAQIADTVAVLGAGRIVDYGSVHRIFTEPAHPLT